MIYFTLNFRVKCDYGEDSYKGQKLALRLVIELHVNKRAEIFCCLNENFLYSYTKIRSKQDA